jgi:hypothetical protein
MIRLMDELFIVYAWYISYMPPPSPHTNCTALQDIHVIACLEIALALNLSVFTTSFRMDPNDCALHNYISGQAPDGLLKVLCETDEVFEKVRAAVHTIRTNKSAKRSYIEQECSPKNRSQKVSE